MKSGRIRDGLDFGGVSGGGVWLEPPTPTEPKLWQPVVRLVAVEISQGKKWIRGTLIRHWLNILLRHYPELNEEIAVIEGFCPQ